ncbi:type IV pilin protein [Lysobacter sp. S4-A87]|uniref:type IV pilin protein n=1 Tax=Lysobacter sp. S4-A87 TaxID=2925843 RepID=UPI001F53565B|nr:type IV pilin protein [Lysobacter sp. S4-A87]UNK50593.1 type IV pilin protein [Lysobacter sp. S4-A87]
MINVASGTGAPRRAARGFTLIELMIVVVVVAILASIAYPTYADSVRKGRRGQAKADVLELAQLAERWRTVNNTYVGFGTPAGDGTLAGSLGKSPRTGKAYYGVKIVATVDTYTLTAAPISGTGQEKDTKCGSLSLTQAGAKSATGSGPGCW